SGERSSALGVSVACARASRTGLKKITARARAKQPARVRMPGPPVRGGGSGCPTAAVAEYSGPGVAPESPSGRLWSARPSVTNSGSAGVTRRRGGSLMIERLALPAWDTAPTPLSAWVERLQGEGLEVVTTRESADVSWLEVDGLRLRGYAVTVGTNVE